MVEIFKTNVQQQEEANNLFALLSEEFPWMDVHFDLEDCDNILRVEGVVVANDKIIACMMQHGYECIVL